MQSIKYGIELRLFAHKLIIKKLTERKFITPEIAEEISEGFCYMLAIDWLFNHNMAEQYYFNPSDNREEAEASMTNEMLKYFAVLAKRFLDYKKYVAGYKDRIISCHYGNDFVYTDLLPSDVFSIDNYFARQYYNVSFNRFETITQLNSFEDILRSQDKSKPSIDLSLLRLTFKEEGGGIFRHTIAMQKVINQINGVRYVFFDPTLGVYRAKSYDTDCSKEDGFEPALFFDSLIRKYQKTYKRKLISTYLSSLTAHYLVIG